MEMKWQKLVRQALQRASRGSAGQFLVRHTLQCLDGSAAPVPLCTTVVHNTAQSSSDNIPLYLQTTTIAQMLPIGGEGRGDIKY